MCGRNWKTEDSMYSFTFLQVGFVKYLIVYFVLGMIYFEKEVNAVYISSI